MRSCQRNGGKIGYGQRFLTTTASGKHQCQRTAKARFALEALDRYNRGYEIAENRSSAYKIAGLVAGERYQSATTGAATSPPIFGVKIYCGSNRSESRMLLRTLRPPNAA